MKKKTLSVILALCLMISVLPVLSFADEAEPALEIISHSITFKDSVFLKYAVSSSDCDSVKLLVWNEEQDDYAYGTQDAIVEPEGTEKVHETECDIFTFTGLTAKQMTDSVYARAYTEKGDKAYYSDVSKYSILDYTYYMQGKTGPGSTDQKLLDLLDSMLAYGACAQKYYDGGKGYHLERLATDTYYQITVVNGCIDSGFTEHLYKEGETVNLTAETPSASEVFSHWENSLGVDVGTEETISITVGNANEVYTAVFEKVPSEGLSFSTSKKTGNATLKGIGGCEDSDVVVPSSYNNYPVVAVDDEAFYGETSITSITIPTTVTSIGDSAFDGCTSLTDIYYLGTTSQWASIDLGEDAIPSTVTIHCNDPLVAHYTVTFMDYDGTTVIKTESVAEGSDATPPENPSREGYTFAKWSGNCSNVTEDRTVTAVYYEGTGSAFIIGDAYITDDASQVAVPIYLNATVGFTAFQVKVNFSGLSLTNVTAGNGFSNMTGAQTYPVSDTVDLIWGNGTSDIDGKLNIATLYFDCSKLAGETATITVEKDSTKVTNVAREKLSFSVIDGMICSSK